MGLELTPVVSTKITSIFSDHTVAQKLSQIEVKPTKISMISVELRIFPYDKDTLIFLAFKRVPQKTM